MRKFTFSLAAVAAFVLGQIATSQAQLTQIGWIGGTGTKNWQDNANWSGGAFPNDTLKVADISVSLGSALSVDVGATDVTVAGVSLGSSSSAVTSTIMTTGAGRLVFHNTDVNIPSTQNDPDFNNDTVVDGQDFLIWQRGFGTVGNGTVHINNLGDADDDFDVDAADLVIWNTQYGSGTGFQNPGTGYIETIGVSGATNVISAPIHLLNEQLEIGGTKNLSISGNLTYDPNTETLVSSAAIRVMNPGLTVTMTGSITTSDTDSGEAIDFAINDHFENQGTFVLDGQLTGNGRVQIGTQSGNSLLRLPLGTVRLNTANASFTGSIRQSRGNLELGNDGALGSGGFTQLGPAEVGYNLIAYGGDRTIANKFTLSRSQTFKGSNSFTMSGDTTQSNNSSVINMLPAGKTVTLSGLIDIWEYDEFDASTPRQITFDGTGKTVVTGQIRDIQAIDQYGTPDYHGAGTFAVYGLDKTGTGVLTISMAGSNTDEHKGATTVRMGNLHYASNASLNQSTDAASKIKAYNGAVGVDAHPAGQTLATNTTFLDKIDPLSHGGLMLASTDAATALNFTAGSLVNAANMSVAAPETGLTYTGTITPAGATYKLGGGQGTLTLPNVQLTGANALVVKNGGKVVLTGDNTYTGKTTIQAKYSNTSQDQAAADLTRNISTVYYKQIAPVLEANHLADGGLASSIGAATNIADNLVIQGSTLRYVGTGDSTNRLFTIGTGGATLDSSGSGAVTFSNTGALAVPDATNKTGDLVGGLSGSNLIKNMSDVSDVVVGMTVDDPQNGTFGTCNLLGAHCIPSGTTVTGITADGKQLTLSAAYPGGINKVATQLVFGAVARELVLTGSNTAANVLSGTMANSTKGGVVNIIKRGTGTWLLNGVSTSTGTTTVEAGILGGDGGVGGTLTVNSGARFNPGPATGVGDFSTGGSFTLSTGGVLGIEISGASTFDVLNVTGAATLSGQLNVALLSYTPAINTTFTVLTTTTGVTDNGLTLTGAAGFTKLISGNNLLLKYVGGALAASLGAVPEPASVMLLGLALALVGTRRRV